MKKQKSSFEMRGLGGVRKTKGDIVFDTCVYVLVTVICLICLYPMLFVLFASFSNGNKLHFHTGPLFAPLFPMTLDGYKTVLANKDIVTGYMNTIIYLLGGTAFSMVLTIMGAYVLSRRGYKLKKFFTIYLALTMYISGGMIPSFLVVRWLHMLDTRWAIIIVGSVSTWNMIVLRTAFASIPKGLEEAAQICPVATLRERLGEAEQLSFTNPMIPPGNLFDTADFEPLTVFNHPHVLRRLHHRFEGAGVEPRGAAVEHLDMQAAAVEICLVYAGDLELPACAWRD